MTAGDAWIRGAEAVPAPMAFVADTSTQYDCPFTKPVIEHCKVAAVQLATAVPALDWLKARATYEVIAEPPSLAGAPQRTVSAPVDGATVSEVGLPGTAAAPGTPEVRGPDGAPVPTALVATTSIQAVEPAARPGMVQVSTEAVQLAIGVPPLAAEKARAV